MTRRDGDARQLGPAGRPAVGGRASPGPASTRSAAAACPARCRASASSGRRPSGSAWTAPSLRRRTLVATWKANFPSFWPGGARFYAPLAGIAPGEVALLDIPPVPGSPVKLSTGVMVLYADDESFTFMTPEGHTLSAWITFSAHHDGEVTVAQAQALERTSDPFDELAYVLGANRLNDRFWRQTLENLARHVGVATPVVDVQAVCIDKRRQWRHAGNVRNSATLRTARHTLTAPVRWITRRG